MKLDMNLNGNMMLLLIVAGAVAALIALVVLVVLIRRYIAFRRRMAEMRNMKKDLMAWGNLHGLVRGGDEGMAAKAAMSSKLGQVRDIFAGGLRQTRAAGLSTVRPWFVLVGEPKSGKTSLLARSGLELRAGVSPETMHESPLVTWLGPRSYTLDVAGRIFFDRWLKGSGAEWDLLVRSIRRRHHHFPASGIILTIPADALLADDPALTREKASIIGSELQQLLKVTGMNLPCHVVITKLDMLLGFRECFGGLDAREATAPFGWQNPAPGGTFDETALTGWLDTLDGRLREDLMARLLDPKVMRDPLAVRHRVDTAGTASLFPDALKSLRGNLSTYLNRLFGKEAWNGHDQLLLSGVFFTAAEDAGVTVSRDFAARCGKGVNETKLVAEPRPQSDGWFIGGLLNDFIFACRVKASFTARELFVRQLPGYFAAVLVAAVGAIWLFAAVFGRGAAREDLEHLTTYYKSVAAHLEADDYTCSPLIGWDGKKGAVFLKDEALRNDPRNTRLTALSQVQMAADETVRAPFGFGMSGLLWFSCNPDLAVRKRQDIANILQTKMVFRPALTALFENFKMDEDPSFSQLKRNAVFDFCHFHLHAPSDRGDAIDLHDVLAYLLPELPVELVNVLATYYADDWCLGAGALPERYEDPRQADEIAERIGHRFQTSWKNLQVYGETVYPKTRSLIRGGDELRQLMAGSAALAKSLGAGETNAAAAVTGWQADLQRMSALRKAMDADVQELKSEPHESLAEELAEKFSAKVNDKLGGKLPAYLPSDPLTDALADYRGLLKRDVADYAALIARMRKIVKGSAGRATVRAAETSVAEMEKAVEVALDAEGRDLRERLTRLVASRLLDDAAVGADPEHPGLSRGVVRHYEVIGDLADAALAAPLPKDPKDLSEFFRTLGEVGRCEAIAEAKLQAAKGGCTNDLLVTDFAATVTALMRVRSRTVRERLIARYAEFHPRTGAGVGEMVATLGTAKETLGIAPSLVSEVFGDIGIAPVYEPAAASVCFDVYSEMMALAHGKEAIPLPNRVEIERAMGEYVDNYVDYWANFGDRLQVPSADWAAYRKRCAELKPYEVNTLLAVIYRRALTVLGEIPKACLTERQVKAVADAAGAIEARIQMLTPHFSDVCLRQATDWSLLEEEPSMAYRFLRECPAALLVSDYFAVDAAGAKGNVPWWTSFFDRGLDLLKRDARQQGVAELNRSRANFLRFPFCSDPVNPEPVRAEELDDVQRLLASCGFSPVVESTVSDGAKPKEDGANRIVAKVRAPYRADAEAPGKDKKTVVDYFAWGERLHAIVETLRDRDHETIWTLSLTPLERSQELNDAKFPALPIANYRYRYGELTVGGEERGGRVALNSHADVQIARGTIDDADLALRLDTYSKGDDVSAVTLRYDGPWAILRLYLLPDSVWDVKSKTCDVPVIVRDRYNLMSVLWLRLKINRSLPKPAEWPSTAGWPDLPLK